MIESVLKHQLGGISKSIKDRLVKSMAGQNERLVERVVPKLNAGEISFESAEEEGDEDNRASFTFRLLSLIDMHEAGGCGLRLQALLLWNG
jgi:hypothetical protein